MENLIIFWTLKTANKSLKNNKYYRKEDHIRKSAITVNNIIYKIISLQTPFGNLIIKGNIILRVLLYFELMYDWL